jgi:hypothetical protein
VIRRRPNAAARGAVEDVVWKALNAVLDLLLVQEVEVEL